ncbi:uncharacterized protein LOC136064636 [Quercus suber]|uniref:uncharacterized protein LOC136064636 n=1 Tax=Quercus suber TaxID=58331 RepID=UPI0032E01553
MKRHLTGIKGDIGSCKKVSHDVRYQMLEYLKEFELKKKAEKQRKRKGTKLVDNYFAPRTTPRAQPGLKSAFQSKEKLRQADMAIARFLYDNCISFNAVNSVYYQRMIDAIVVASPGYKVNASEIVKSTRNLFILFDEVVTWVGPKNIVHIVIDNASNYVSARIDLVGQILYVWEQQDFTTTFLSFGSIHVHKHDLQALVTSKFFVDNTLARELKAKEAISIILDNSFWDDINVLVKISSPLICLLWIVNSDQRLAIRYVYEGMHRARLGIKKNFRMKKHLYKPYTSIIKNRWDKHLRKDFHATAYWLNLAFQYYEENFCQKAIVNMVNLDYIGTKYDGDQGKEDPYLNYEELENAIYEEGAYPASAGPSSNIEESIDDSSEVEGIDLGTFGQPIGPPPRFLGNDDEHDNFHNIDGL